MFVFQGLYTDTDDFGPFFSLADANFVAFGDDDTGPFVPGPIGDPFVSFNAPTTGFYTIAVTNFLSSANPPFDFQITATGIVNAPEPASMAVFGLIAVGAFGVRRRLKATS
jgi:hypothetical protein